MRAFIIRPFGSKGGIDFDRVEALLIGPALDRVGATGRTTGDVVEAGNIREDMFQLLLVADLVVADISIDNPNAYYELGIRHALREKRTFLVRATGATNDVPFDLRTDRYLPYDPAAPAKALDALAAGLQATITADRQDSPVFRLLPQLVEQERSKFLPVPLGFREDVDHAARTNMRGKLALLGQEARGALWETEGLRLVAREQFNAKAFEAAVVTLEDLRTLLPFDAETNLLLGTACERLGDAARSELALARVVDRSGVPAADLAEAWSLIGRNIKSRWRDEWRSLPMDERRRRAFDSPLLLQAGEAYEKAFRQHLNHFYSGLNALALLTVLRELVDALPDAWIDRHGGKKDAQAARRVLEERRRTLAGAVSLAIAAAEQREMLAQKPDPWRAISAADLRFLTATQAGPVVNAYRAALAGQPAFMCDSVRSQLRLYQDLDLFAATVKRVLDVLPPAPADPQPDASRRAVLFTGHRIDAPNRAVPRFPADQEPVVRAAIRDALSRELAPGRPLRGIAGGASGGDILFHEVCAELGIPTTLFLAVPADAYVAASVAPAGGDWIRRFWAIQGRAPGAVLSTTAALPGWLRHRAGYEVWGRNSLWLLNEALADGARNLTVLALWDGKPGDGPGGTADLVAIARARGAETHVLDTDTLFQHARTAGA